jgi:hypothetical protein
MKRHLVLAIAALSVATAVWAADLETGNVVSIDPVANTFTIETDGGSRIAFHTTATATRMTRDEIVISLGDLTAGTRVRVTADDAVGTEPRHASRVELIDTEPTDVSDTSADDQSDGSQLASNDRLPSTASPLPLIGLLGSGGMLAGLILRKLRR